MNRFAKPTIAALCLAALTLTGCSTPAATTPTSTIAATTSSPVNAGATTEAETAAIGTGVTSFLADNTASHAEPDDAEYDASSATAITLSDQDVTISEPGTYLVSGSMREAQLTVDSAAEGKVTLVLSGVTMTSSSGAPIMVKAADEMVIVLAEGTESSITDTSPAQASSDPDAADAAIFSMSDLTITGTGTLQVTSANNDAVASKDGLVVASGTIGIEAGDDGLRGKDYVIVEGGTLSIEAGSDAIKATNEDDDTVGYVSISGGLTTLDAGDDAVHAEGDLVVSGGTLTIASSVEGLEGANIVIAGGVTSVTSSDDGLNATSGAAMGGPGGGPGGGEASDGSQLVITGGQLRVNAEGDGLDSNGTATMTGGDVVVNGPTGNGNGSLDASSFTISGGRLIAAGSAGMVVTPSSASTQGWIAISTQLTANQTLEVSDSTTAVASFTAIKPAASIIVSVPGMVTSQTYQVSVAGGNATSVTAGQGAASDRGPGAR